MKSLIEKAIKKWEETVKGWKHFDAYVSNIENEFIRSMIYSALGLICISIPAIGIGIILAVGYLELLALFVIGCVVLYLVLVIAYAIGKTIFDGCD